MAFSNLLDLIFPPVCLHCQTNVRRGISLCAQCTASIRLNHTLFCGKCHARIPIRINPNPPCRPRPRSESRAGSSGDPVIHPRVKRICHTDFPYILGAATEYDSPVIKSLIHALKFRFIKNAAAPLADYLALYIEEIKIPLNEYSLIPLPLSKKRLRERGFNQSDLIASSLAARFDLPIEKNALLRVKHSKPQSETKGVDARRENVKTSFAVRDPRLIAGKNILLIDDVTTSGATFFAAATALKSAGAKKIIALAAARA